MIGTWLSLLAIASTVWVWLDGLRAREQAIRHGHALCQEAGVQLLDQTVALSRIRVKQRHGLPTFVRRYGFEVSLNGSDRHRGHLDLGGHHLEAWSVPLAENIAPAAVQPRALQLVRENED